MTETEELLAQLIADLMMGFEAVKEDYIETIAQLTETSPDIVRRRLNDRMPELLEKVQSKVTVALDASKRSRNGQK